eukprot:EG_transcript_11205
MLSAPDFPPRLSAVGPYNRPARPNLYGDIKALRPNPFCGLLESHHLCPQVNPPCWRRWRWGVQSGFIPVSDGRCEWQAAWTTTSIPSRPPQGEVSLGFCTLLLLLLLLLLLVIRTLWAA